MVTDRKILRVSLSNVSVLKLKHVRLRLTGFREESIGNKRGGDGHPRG